MWDDSSPQTLEPPAFVSACVISSGTNLFEIALSYPCTNKLLEIVHLVPVFANAKDPRIKGQYSWLDLIARNYPAEFEFIGRVMFWPISKETRWEYSRTTVTNCQRILFHDNPAAGIRSGANGKRRVVWEGKAKVISMLFVLEHVPLSRLLKVPLFHITTQFQLSAPEKQSPWDI
jgi:hypothetical protein